MTNSFLFSSGCSANQQSTTTLTAPSLYDFFPKPQSRRLPFNANCQWKITAPVGKVVKIWVNKARFNGPCNDEYLRIYDGPSKSSNILVQYCNGAISSRLSLYFISTGRDMFLDVKTGITNSTRLSVYFQAEDFQGNCCKCKPQTFFKLHMLNFCQKKLVLCSKTFNVQKFYGAHV